MRYAFGRCWLDTATRHLTREGVAVHLSPKAFALLRLLIDARPRVVTKAELMEHIWPDAFVVEANLPVLVGEVRTALGDQSSAASAIRTHHGVGYSFVSDVRESRSVSGLARADATGCSLQVGNRRIGLSAGANTVGRGQDSDVCLNDASVSRHHARIVIEGSAAHIEDLESRNGTVVQGQRVLETTALVHGDEIDFGGVKARFLLDRTDEPSTLDLDVHGPDAGS